LQTATRVFPPGVRRGFAKNYKGRKSTRARCWRSSEQDLFFPERRISLIFDFQTFSRLVAYNLPEDGFNLEDTLKVFRYYFECYEQRFGRPHPNIRVSQIVGMAKKMPSVTIEDRGRYGSVENLTVGEYIGEGCMIDRHFQTQYRNCDYNINHFFSGRVRELRWLETCY
jgi:hypothetical protein